MSLGGAQREVQHARADGHDRQAHVEDRAADRGGRPGADARAEERAHGEPGEVQRGLHRGQAEPDLEEEAGGQREADDAAEEDHREDDAGDVRPLAQHAQLDQRGLAPGDPAALAAADDVEQRGRGRDHADQPDRPAERAALDQREHDQEADHGGQRDADPVEAGAAVGGLAGRQHPAADDDREQADRDVDQEQRAPVGAERVELDQERRPRPGRAPSRGRSPDRTPRTPCRCRPDRRCRGSARRSAGSSPPPRAPGATRPAISDSDDQATEQSTDDATNPTSPVISIRLRPKASPSRPPASSPTAMARVYAAAIHSSADADSDRSRWIDGAATLRIVESRMLRIIALRITAKPIHLPGAGRVSGCVTGCLGRFGSAVRGRSSCRSWVSRLSCPRRLGADQERFVPHCE